MLNHEITPQGNLEKIQELRWFKCEKDKGLKIHYRELYSLAKNCEKPEDNSLSSLEWKTNLVVEQVFFKNGFRSTPDIKFHKTMISTPPHLHPHKCALKFKIWMLGEKNLTCLEAKCLNHKMIRKGTLWVEYKLEDLYKALSYEQFAFSIGIYSFKALFKLFHLIAKTKIKKMY